MNLKTIENESNQTSEKNDNKENRDISNQKESKQRKKDNEKDMGRNSNEFKKNNITSLLSLSLGDFDFNKKKGNKIITERDKMCTYSNSNIASDKNDKIKVLILLELIKNKKTERELIDKTKDEIMQRSRSQAVDRKKELTPEVNHIDNNDNDNNNENKQLEKTEEKDNNTNKNTDNKNSQNKDKDSGKDKDKDKDNSDKKNREANTNMKIQRIYKKNSSINKICTSFKASNF